MRFRWLLLMLAGATFAIGCPDDTDDDDAGDDDAEDDDTGDDDTGDDDTGDDDTGDDDVGDDDVGDDDSGDDDTTGPAEIVSTYPHDGSTSFFHEHSIVAEFSSPPGNPGIVVDEFGGPNVPGTLSVDPTGTIVTFDPHDTSPTDHLLLNTDYVAIISWDQHPDVALHFRTANPGNPVADPDTTVDGEDYWLDLGTANFVEPPGMGALLGQYLSEAYIAIHVVDVDDTGGTIDAFGGYLAPDAPGYLQDLCVETLPLTDQQPGLWANPFMQVGPSDATFGIEGYPVDMFDVLVTGSFATDGSQLQQGTFGGDIDTRGMDPLIDPQAKVGATCQLMASLGIYCDPCPDGTGPYCLYLYATDIVAPQVEVHGTDPQTQQQFSTMTEVTAATLAAWTAGGYCP
jgi:hypothetical protein